MSVQEVAKLLFITICILVLYVTIGILNSKKKVQLTYNLATDVFYHRGVHRSLPSSVSLQSVHLPAYRVVPELGFYPLDPQDKSVDHQVSAVQEASGKIKITFMSFFTGNCREYGTFTTEPS